MNITVRQRENGKWQAIVSYKDKKGKWRQKPKGGFDKKKDANQWGKEKYFELLKLEKSGVLGDEYTLEEVFELYLARMEKTSHKDTKSSQKTYKDCMDIFADFLERDISSIKATEIYDFIETKRKLTGNNYNVNISVLSMIYNFAIKKVRACENNPCDLLYYDKSKEDKRIKFITEDLYKKILDGTKNEKIKLMTQLLYETGMRIGEAFGLCTQNVINGTIEVKQQFTREKVLSEFLKTSNSYRTIPISDDLYRKLKRATFDFQGRIFYDLTYSGLYTHFKKYRISPHCFRHTRATILVGSGIDLTVVSYVIGDEIETIMNTYVEVNEDNIGEKFDQIRALVWIFLTNFWREK